MRLSAFVGAVLVAVGGGLTAASALQPAGSHRSGSIQSATMQDAAARARESASCFQKTPLEWIGSAYINGYSNATKLRESTLVGEGIGGHPPATLEGLHNMYAVFDICHGNLYSYLTGVLDFHNLPQMPLARSTFLSFGFQPITATMELTEVPLAAGCRDVIGHQIAPPPIYTCLIAFNPANNPNGYTVTVTSSVEIRVLDVKVNGTPLNVGPACRTAVPVPLTLIGNAKQHYDVTKGGLLMGTFIIGKFTQCGTSENLDPLFDTTLSGAKNLIKITQGPTCVDFINPPNGPNKNCLINPGPGHPWGIPKHVPIPLR